MDLLKLFALLVAVATVQISAEGPKKKIRIHLPQKVKHIHHHKKIYITNHPASSQYAPAYMPSAEGTMTAPASVAVGGLLPVSPADMFDEPAARAPAASKLLPLYHGRGHYGPSPSDWDDQEYDLSPPPEPADISYGPTAFTGPSAIAAPLTNYSPKVKIVKLKDHPRKKVVRKGKPKRVPPRNKPHLDEEIPVTTFHEQFYSDLDGSATLRKVKKPQRVEKIIDGDTEHIHTYSEEHVHKLVYDDGRSRLLGVDPVGGMSTLSASHQIFPVKNSLLALSPDTLTGLASIGSLGTPSHLEYSAYNPRDVTHDHVFHDHGEIPSDLDVSKENLPFPPRVSYNSQGVRIGGLGSKSHKNKIPLHSFSKPTKPTAVNDYSYYENMYTPYSRHKAPRPTNPASIYNPTTGTVSDDYKSIPSFKLRDKGHIKSHNVPLPVLNFAAKQVPEYRSQRASDPSPYAVSSTVVHDYSPKNYASATSDVFGYSKFRDPLQNFKDNSYTSNLNFDSYASATSSLYSDNKFNPSSYLGKKGKKKSISTQNIRIGGLDHQTTVDHLGDAGLSTFLNDGLPTAVDFGESKHIQTITSPPYTIRESSPAHPYYSAMAAKALHGEDQMQVAESSNTNVQYVEAPTTEFPMATTNEHFAPDSSEQVSTEVIESAETTRTIETRPNHSVQDLKGNFSSQKDTRQRYSDLQVKDYKSADRPFESHHKITRHRLRHLHSNGAETPPDNAGSRKYGDKI